MILIPTTADVRLMLEDADQPIGEVVALALMLMRWGWTQATSDVLHTVAYIACHPKLGARMRAAECGVELSFEPVEARVTVDGVQLQPWVMGVAQMDGMMSAAHLMAGLGLICGRDTPATHELGWSSALFSSRAIELWIKALRVCIDERMRSGEVVTATVLADTDEIEVAP